MVRGKVSVITGVDKIADIKKQLSELTHKRVLVGIPEEASTRENSGDINNAELLYIQSHGVRKSEMRQEMDKSIVKGMKYSAAHSLYVKEHGSPLWHVPPRPVLEPAIEDSKEIIGRQMGRVSAAALDGNVAQVNVELEKAGMLGASAARAWFESPKNGWTENALSTQKAKGSVQPLVDTNAMRQAITYVIRAKE